MPEPQPIHTDTNLRPRLEIEIPIPEHTGLLAIVQYGGRLDVFGYDFARHRLLSSRNGQAMLRISGSWDGKRMKLPPDPRFRPAERDALIRALRKADPAGGVP